MQKVFSMALISVRNISISYFETPLLDDVSLHIERNERICLLGRNGSGKSTLMKIITDDVAADSGEIIFQKGTKVSYLPQEIPDIPGKNVSDITASGLEVGTGEKDLKTRKALSLLGLDGEQLYSELSGGMKRKALMARAIVSDPDVLLLDEPTNHLDINGILWLEEFLLRFRGSILFVTHDRSLLKKLATRIVEMDRGTLVPYNCDYETYLRRRGERLEAEEKQWENFDKKLAEEEVWIRQGIQGRRTRNEGRVRALKKMREERRNRRERVGKANLKIEESDRSGNDVIKAKNISFAYDNNRIVNKLTTFVQRGDRIGLIGPNGSGKTTLLHLLLKEIEPQEGTVKHGANLEIAFFDQLRASLDEEKTVGQNVADEGDYVIQNGRKRHVINYLSDFLFTRDRVKSKVKVLSGGERNRLLLSRLFCKGSNVLVLDEPTNDLDIETLELLEERIQEYSGTVFLVSHDRTFLDNVVTASYVLPGDGTITEIAGGYGAWERLAGETGREKGKGERGRKSNQSSVISNQEKEKQQKRPKLRKITYKEQMELKELPGKIEILEKYQTELHDLMTDPGFYKQTGEVIAKTTEELKQIETELEAAYARWEKLEELEGK